MSGVRELADKNSVRIRGQLRLQATEDFHAVEAGQHQVEQQNVRLGSQANVDRFLAGAAAADDLVAKRVAADQLKLDQVTRNTVVINQNHSQFCIHSGICYFVETKQGLYRCVSRRGGNPPHFYWGHCARQIRVLPLADEFGSDG